VAADPADALVRRVIADLWDTLDSHHGVGIAAPQIGARFRVIAVDATRAKRPVENHGRLTLLNPRILESTGQTSFREGCLSVPDMVAHIRRAEQVTVAATFPDGKPYTLLARGFEAVIIQHEIDHLDGVLFIDRVHSARDIKPRLR
jgi:peptide deformylase